MARTRLTRSERASLTRDDLLEAAEARFLRDGYHATTLGAIAEDAGYTKGAVYSAYESKAGLFLALFDAVAERRVEAIRRLLDGHEDRGDALAALARRPADDRNAHFLLLVIEFLIHAARQPELLEQFADRHRRLRASMAELAPPCSALTAEEWAIVTFSLSNGIALERLIDPDGVPDDLMAVVQSRIAG
ncbi:MAG: TetR/AcrR family transcriptional regulator [Solirubrobacteraceae bacterium]